MASSSLESPQPFDDFVQNFLEGGLIDLIYRAVMDEATFPACGDAVDVARRECDFMPHEVSLEHSASYRDLRRTASELKAKSKYKQNHNEFCV
jgi:hypothetical protein